MGSMQDLQLGPHNLLDTASRRIIQSSFLTPGLFMRWEQTEFLLKGLYLGLLALVAVHNPTWLQIGQVAAFTFAGLTLCLAVAGFRKAREGFTVKGKWVGFILFLLLENPSLVFGGILIGLGAGAT